MEASVNPTSRSYPPVGRLPKNYRLLLDLMRESGPGAHRSTAEIFGEARLRWPTIGYSTVQRGLARLAAVGLLMRVHLPGSDTTLYEAVAEGHAHFSCGRCGVTVDVPYVTPSSVRERLASDLGLTITSESLTFSGFCGACNGPA